MSQVYARAKSTDPWEFMHSTCWPDQPDRPADAAAGPTVADVMREFAALPFVTPSGVVQPLGGVTLVNLPTFFQVVWPAGGVRPGYVHATTLLGHAVEIRVELGGYDYAFGDGGTLSSMSPGGPYPDGDVRHTYTKSAVVDPSVTVTFAGSYRVDGGAWQKLPGTATRTLAYPPLSVATAENRLIPNR